MTREIKQRAKALGADLVGVTPLKAEYVYAGHEVPYRYAISIGVAMNRDRMRNVPDDTSAGEVMRIYARIGEIASTLSEEIRAMGWPARAYGNPNSGDLLGASQGRMPLPRPLCGLPGDGRAVDLPGEGLRARASGDCASTSGEVSFSGESKHRGLTRRRISVIENRPRAISDERWG